MKRLKITIFVLVVAVVAVTITVLLLTNRNKPEPPPIAAAYALVDLNTGSTLFENKPEQQNRIGSLTKLMPVYICFQEIERGNISPDDIVTISNAAVSTPGPTNNLKEGMEISLDSLLYCVLISSGNDAITAITEFISEDESVMVERMNITAGELGMKNTFYADCTGINPFDNRSSAQDLTILVKELLNDFPQVINYTRLQEKIVKGICNGAEIELVLRNTNILLGVMDGVYGLKTGTAQESYNAIVLLNHEEKNYMAIILGAPNNTIRWDSVRKLLEYGMAR